MITNLQNKTRIKVYNEAVYKLNVKSSKWKILSEFKSKRRAHQSTIIGDKMYLVAGYNGTHVADTEIIPIKNNEKTLIPTIPLMHIERSSFETCSFSGCIFVAGGCNNGGSLDKCEVYSTESGEWIEASGMNTKREAFALIYFQGKIWAIGGFNGNDFLDTIEIYNLADNTWTTVDTKLQTKRCGHRAVVHNKKFFVIGGFYQGKALTSVEVYSSKTNQFNFVSLMSQARACFGCSIFNNNLIVFGGYLNSTEITDSAEVYDIEKDVWRKVLNLPIPLADFGYSTTY